MKNPVIFASTCPICGQPKLQRVYTRRALTKLIESSQIIDAYCVSCDVVWPVSAQERISLAAAITAASGYVTPLSQATQPW
jgi:hypothetical protein